MTWEDTLAALLLISAPIVGGIWFWRMMKLDLELFKLNLKFQAGYHPDEFLPPSWAEGKAYGFLVEGAQLPTRDGRKIGNAHIISKEDESGHYRVITDAGNIVHMTASEIRTLFHAPIYYSNVSEVLSKFSKKD